MNIEDHPLYAVLEDLCGRMPTIQLGSFALSVVILSPAGLDNTPTCALLTVRAGTLLAHGMISERLYFRLSKCAMYRGTITDGAPSELTYLVNRSNIADRVEMMQGLLAEVSQQRRRRDRAPAH